MLRKVKNKDEILQRIKTPEVKEYLKEKGIKHLRLFGSFAREEQTPTSDVDFLYEENPKAKIGRELFFLADFLKQKL
jgi:predicted nucleotidyltransferase